MLEFIRGQASSPPLFSISRIFNKIKVHDNLRLVAVIHSYRSYIAPVLCIHLYQTKKREKKRKSMITKFYSLRSDNICCVDTKQFAWKVEIEVILMCIEFIYCV